MGNTPAELRYSKSHEWVRDEGDGIVTIGISDHAQEQLGDLVFVELPEVGKQLNAGEESCVVASVKAAADVYSPLTGEVVATNSALEDAPELVNTDPYGEGWLMKLRIANGDALNGMLDAAAYQAVADGES
jgi:glycine cleavage system H protein